MKNLTILIVMMLMQVFNVQAQGVSMSFIIPKDGYLSTPVSPFSIRGLGFKKRVIGLSTGGSLYSMPGLPLEGLPFESDKPLVGPFWSVLVPLQMTLRKEGRKVSVQLLAGGFGMWHLFPKVNYGNLDAAIRDYEGWDVANADLELKNRLGYGWMVGTEFMFHVNRKYSLTVEVEYLSGSSSLPLNGNYFGGNIGSEILTREVEYKDAAVLLQGFEISLGIVMN